MFRRSAERYVILQDYIPARERRMLEQMLVSVMLPVAPPHAFVERLRRDLVEEARRQHSVQQQHTDRMFRLFGVFSGVVSLVGGLVLWFVLRQEHGPSSVHKHAASEQEPSGAPRQGASAAPRSA
jgi:hypothetical protein